MKTIKWFLITILSGMLFSILFIPFFIFQSLIRIIAFFIGSNFFGYDKLTLWYYFKQIAISIDVASGSIIYGSRHTISAITGYRSYNNKFSYRIQEKIIDYIFYKGHCRNAAIKEGLIK